MLLIDQQTKTFYHIKQKKPKQTKQSSITIQLHMENKITLVKSQKCMGNLINYGTLQSKQEKKKQKKRRRKGHMEE